MAEDADTWTELKADVADWLNRDDLTTQIPKFIAGAEREFNRVLRVPEMEEAADLTIDAATEDLPADFLEMRSLYLNTDPKVVLEQMTLADLRHYHSASASGQPRHFAIQSGSTLVLGPAPDGIYTGKLSYYQKIPALSASVADNWLLLAHPDIYLAGALWRAYAFLNDDTNTAKWKAVMDGGLDQLMKAGRRKAYSAAPLRIRSAYNV